MTSRPPGHSWPRRAWVGRGGAIGAAVFDRRARLLGSPKRELRASALLHRKPIRIPSARASGFPAAGSRRDRRLRASRHRAAGGCRPSKARQDAVPRPWTARQDGGPSPAGGCRPSKARQDAVPRPWTARQDGGPSPAGGCRPSKARQDAVPRPWTARQDGGPSPAGGCRPSKARQDAEALRVVRTRGLRSACRSGGSGAGPAAGEWACSPRRTTCGVAGSTRAV
jgi:hypothetical protein